MKFNVLGPLEVLHDSEPCTPSATKICWTLALLLVRANQVVNQAAIIDELWGENPPRSAVTTAQTYIYQLRKKYDRYSPNGTFILTRAPGYVLHVAPEQLDVQVFDRLTEEGRTLLSCGHLEAATQKFTAALKLWRGPALADLPSVGSLLSAHITHLEELRRRTMQLRVLADAGLGRFHELVPQLRSMAIENPTDEWVHEQLIIALDQVGRRGDALTVYRTLQRTLDQELGIQPCASLRDLQHDLLVGTENPVPALSVRLAG